MFDILSLHYFLELCFELPVCPSVKEGKLPVSRNVYF